MRIFASDASKAWSEKFFLLYAVLWVSYFCVLITFDLYEGASELGWFMFGFVMFVPCFLYPLLFPGKVDQHVPLLERFWVKANLWIFIFNFAANYFWTHYFYDVLGANYTLKTYRINNVPWLMFWCTQAYFTMYHSLTNVLQRVYDALVLQPLGKNNKIVRAVLYWLFIFALSYVTAFMETYGSFSTSHMLHRYTIQKFPYYTHQDKDAMYSYGSLFYALYFIVSFPMYYRIEEDPVAPKWSLQQVALDALAASMLVTFLLDFWRLFIGPIVPNAVPSHVPWMK